MPDPYFNQRLAEAQAEADLEQIDPEPEGPVETSSAPPLHWAWLLCFALAAFSVTWATGWAVQHLRERAAETAEAIVTTVP